MGTRAEHLAERVEQGANELIAAVQNLTDQQWQTRCGSENRTVAVLVHHVGTMYPVEVDVIQTLIDKGGMRDLVWDAVDGINAEHATTNEDVEPQSAIDLVRQNSVRAADVIRNLTDEQLDAVAPSGLHWQAPLSVQFFVEHHPVAHPYIHLESIKAALA